MTLRNIFNWFADTNILIVIGVIAGIVFGVIVVLPTIFALVIAVLASFKNNK